ncbi:hypothetical protein L2662_07810, partial [Lactobacillus jensenii]|nr:hypothetical protein [Lactobacillus jensenii]MCZ3737266.1 hypothetical protein [Lactobacillus jensenii]
MVSAATFPAYFLK